MCSQIQERGRGRYFGREFFLAILTGEAGASGEHVSAREELVAPSVFPTSAHHAHVRVDGEYDGGPVARAGGRLVGPGIKYKGLKLGPSSISRFGQFS